MFSIAAISVLIALAVSTSSAAPTEGKGCIRDNTKQLEIGEKMTINDVVYECKNDPNTNSPALAPWGCAKDGRQYAANTTFEIGQFWYTCQIKEKIIALEMSGCVNENVRFKDGDRIFKGDIILECIVKANEGKTKVVGCMDADSTGKKIERRNGCTWTVGDAPFEVTMTCIPDQEAKTAVATVVRCNYKMPQGTVYSIEIGCYRVYEKVAVGCRKDAGTGKVNVLQLEINEKGDVQSEPQGLRYC